LKSTFEGENEDLWKSLIAETECSFSENMDDVDNKSDTVSLTDMSETSEEELVQLSGTVDETTDSTKLDTCIQPADPAADAFSIFTLAPEGQYPLHLLTDPSSEEQCFPQLFPTGCFGFDFEQKVQITPKKYFIARILNKDGNFSKILSICSMLNI
jgi:hypothetical protein